MVSIIIPVYNAAPYLLRAVDSARAQVQWKGGTTPGKVAGEIILVDNNSTDESPAMIAALAAKYPGLVTATSCSIQGCSAARNKGLELAQGEWIQFLDADDELLPGKLAHQLALLQPETRWVISAYRNSYTDGSKSDVIPHLDPWRGLVYQFQIGCTCSNLYHREALRKVGAWTESLQQVTDPDLHFRLLRADVPYQLDNEVLTLYHHHGSPDRVSSSNPVAANLGRVELYQRINEYLATTRPGYWETHQDHFAAALLRALRILATYDLPTADMHHRRYFQLPMYEDLPAKLPIIPTYIQQAHRLLGFRAAEGSRRLLGKTLRFIGFPGSSPT